MATAVIAALAGALILVGIVYDTARLVTPREPRCPGYLAGVPCSRPTSAG
ncbi:MULTISPECIES: hypothetical protein [Streptomyces]